MFYELLDEETKGSLPADLLAKMEQEYAASSVGNVEIALKWFMLSIHNNYQPAFQAAAKYATEHGRLKYCRPILRDLAKTTAGRELALRTFEENKEFYHPHGRKMIAQDLYGKSI